MIPKKITKKFIRQSYYFVNDFKLKYIWIKDILKQNKLQKVFINQYSIWKKTFKTILQLSCFVGHPVSKKEILIIFSLTNVQRLKTEKLFMPHASTVSTVGFPAEEKYAKICNFACEFRKLLQTSKFCWEFAQNSFHANSAFLH